MGCSRSRIRRGNVKLFVSFCQANEWKIIAVATAATRRASNQKAFIRRLKMKQGLISKYYQVNKAHLDI